MEAKKQLLVTGIIFHGVNTLKIVKIQEMVHELPHYKNPINIHHDFSPKWMQRDEENVTAIIDVINENFISSF